MGTQFDWDLSSLQVATLLVLVIVGAFVGPSLLHSIAETSAPPLTDAQVQQIEIFFSVFAAILVITVPLVGLGYLYGTALFWAFFMPASLGTVRERMQRALVPYALTLPIAGMVSTAVNLVSFGIFAVVLSTINFSSTDANTAISSIFGVLSLLYLVALAVGIYGFCLFLQSGSVGTTMSRWAVFGITLLFGFIAYIGLWLIFLILGAIISATVPQQTGFHIVHGVIQGAVHVLTVL